MNPQVDKMTLPDNHNTAAGHTPLLRRPVDAVRRRFAGRIRDKAIERARTRIYLHGRRPEDYEPDVLETIVKEEEDKIVSEYKSRGILGLLAALGLSFF